MSAPHIGDYVICTNGKAGTIEAITATDAGLGIHRYTVHHGTHNRHYFLDELISLAIETVGTGR